MIRGAGGGGKSGGGEARAPVESADNLRSRQYARVLDLVSEGEVDGLVDGLKSVYLDDTPIQNPDGSYNFSGVTLITRNGTQSQSYIPGFSAVEAETAVGVEVTNAGSVTRSISNANVNAAVVTISVPRLTLQNTTNGDLGGTSVSLAIDVQNDGGGFAAQPLRSVFSKAGFALSESLATNSIPNTQFSITVAWAGQEGDGRQTCSCQLQYRPVGSGTWLVAQSHTFETTYKSDAYAIAQYLASRLSGGIVAPATSNDIRSFYITLANGLYEFRVVKTTGSISEHDGPSSGPSYGGAVYLIDATSWTPDYTDVISGKTTSRYQRSYRINLTGTGPWDIRVRRLTADSISSNLQDATYWDSYTEVIDAKLKYPNSALVALAVDAERFRAIPRRGYEMKGLKVRIPSNYDPVLRTYTGVWDGTFTIAWTNNPAWCFYDLLTAERYGLGAFIDATQVDKWTLYQIAQYCDELVDDGLGGLEPRFTCNLYLQTREEAYKVINYMASIFRGMTYWAGGAIVPVQDAPSDPVALFTKANIVGEFNYSGSSIKTRHTVALVSWNDPADRYKQKIEYVEDADGIDLYGVNQTELVAIGCTSRGQAHRLGRWLLYTERMETEMVAFRAGLDGLAVAPGEIIQTSDAVRAGVRMGGRLISATTSTVTLDAAVEIDATKTYTLWAVLPDGTVESRAVTTGAGTTADLTVSPDFTSAPQGMAMWVLAASDLVPETWRVISVGEVDGTQAEVTALAYRSDKYLAVEQDLILEPLQTSALNSAPAMPTDLIVSESLYLVTPVVVSTRLTVSWMGGTALYELQYRRMPGNWTTITTSTASVDIQPVEAGDYEFILTGVNSIGRRSQSRTLSKEILGKIAPPADVTGFSVIKASGVALASWLQHPDLDVKVGGRIVIRHSPASSGTNWNDGYIVEEFGGDAITGLIPLITGTYFAKALDSSGNWSENEVSFVATEGMVTGFTTVGTSTQAPTFTGTKTSVAVVSSALQLDASIPIDSIATLIDTWSEIDTFGGAASSGSYAFDTYMDLTTVATRRFEADITALSFDTGDFIDARLSLIDDWDAFDGTVINDCDVTLYASTTDDNPAGTPTWGAWTPFFVSDFTCRALKFKIDFTSGQNTHNIAISQLTVHAKIPA